MGPVGQPVEGRRGEQGLAEEVRPLGPVAVAREQDRRLLVPLVDDVVEVLGAGRPERLEAEVVEDEEIGAQVAGEALLDGCRRPGRRRDG